MAKFLTMDDFDFKNKTALVRVDFNSNIDPKTKKILEAPRIRAHGETTIEELVKKGAKVVILAHQGRPGDPDFAPLKQHAEFLSKVLGKPVKYVDDLFGEKAQKAIKQLKSGEVLVLKNVRTYPDELKKGTPEEQAKSEFVQKLAPLADVFVNDAFSAAHRAQISIVGFTAVLPSVAGRIMERELKALTKAVERPEKPCVYLSSSSSHPPLPTSALRLVRPVQLCARIERAIMERPGRAIGESSTFSWRIYRAF